MEHFNNGNEFYNLKEYKKAIELYTEAIKNNQNCACSYYNCGVCYIKLKDYDNAIHMIKKAIEYQCESKYFFNLAYCYAMKGLNNKALIYFNLSWSLDNNDKDCEKAINLLVSKYKKAL